MPLVVEVITMYMYVYNMYIVYVYMYIQVHVYTRSYTCTFIVLYVQCVYRTYNMHDIVYTMCIYM